MMDLKTQVFFLLEIQILKRIKKKKRQNNFDIVNTVTVN